jgi:penicillin-binding protein 2
MHPGTVVLLLKAVMTASWQGSLAMLLILILRPLLGLRVPARWRCVLWIFVLVRLLVPAFILPPSPASLQNITVIERPTERAAIAFDEAYTSYLKAGRTGNQESNFVTSAMQNPPPVSRPQFHWRKIPWWRLGAAIWAVGATLLAVWIFGATLRLHRRISQDAGTVNESVAAIWDSCCERFSLARAPRLFVMRWITSPALVGVVRPVLLIPAEGTETYSREDWENVFVHELAHYSRGDHWTNVIQLVALCVHWFNPLVWLGFRFLAADRELAADELALERLKADRAVGYGDTLLKVLSAHSARGFRLGMIGIADDNAQLKQRFRRIAAFEPPRMIGSAAGAALILVVAVIVLGRESNSVDMSRYRTMKPAEALVSAAAKDDLSALRKLLDEGADIDGIASVSGEKTALSAAAAANRMDIVRFLVTKGAQINPDGGQSSPALLAAFRNGSIGCGEYLLAKGAFCDPEALAAAKREDASRNDRVYQVSVPAQRGQILDRHGKVLATNRVTYNLAIHFPNLRLSDSEALDFVSQQVATANSVISGRAIDFSREAVLRHYKDRGMLPLDIADDLSPEQQAAVTKHGHGLTLRPVFQRFYPNGSATAHILGYTGRAANSRDGRLQDRFAAEFEEGRDGLESSFDDVLTCKPGQRTYHFNAQGVQVSEEMTKLPQPGNDLVTTLDLDIQKLCEKALKEGSKRGAIVMLDPNTGEVLAMASCPAFDPNLFIPAISIKDWKSLTDDPDIPLVNRALAAYPPGSMFKAFTGLAALESGAVKLDEKIPNPPALVIGDYSFRDWKNFDRGPLTFAEALGQNADTWFSQAGMKTGKRRIVDWALKFGFSRKTGIPLSNEREGVIPTDDYMKKLNKRWDEAWVANLSIGQGVTLATPIQIARAMAALGNGGTLEQPRLANLVRNQDGKTLGEYQRQSQEQLHVKPEILAELKKAMVAVVNGNEGSGRAAAVGGVQVAGESGSAQWIDSAKTPRTLSWFAGFAPADQPAYAFAVVTENDRDSERGNSMAAPIMGKVLRELFK